MDVNGTDLQNTQSNTYMTFTQWLKCKLLMFIPVVNLVLLLHWAIDETKYPEKRAWAAAYLVTMGIAILSFWV